MKDSGGMNEATSHTMCGKEVTQLQGGRLNARAGASQVRGQEGQQRLNILRQLQRHRYT
jgi:hypothetical protein